MSLLTNIDDHNHSTFLALENGQIGMSSCISAVDTTRSAEISCHYFKPSFQTGVVINPDVDAE